MDLPLGAFVVLMETTNPKKIGPGALLGVQIDFFIGIFGGKNLCLLFEICHVKYLWQKNK